MSERPKPQAPRPTWRVRGIDRSTQESIEFDIEAADEASAREEGASRGLLVLDVEDARDAAALATASYMVRRFASLAVMYWIGLFSAGFYQLQSRGSPVVRLNGAMAYAVGACLLFLPVPLLRAVHVQQENGSVDDYPTIFLIALGFAAVGFILFAYLY